MPSPEGLSLTGNQKGTTSLLSFFRHPKREAGGGGGCAFLFVGCVFPGPSRCPPPDDVRWQLSCVSCASCCASRVNTCRWAEGAEGELGRWTEFLRRFAMYAGTPFVSETKQAKKPFLCASALQTNGRRGRRSIWT